MRCAVLGDPIEHSLSPVLHTAGYAALGLDWTYEAVRVGSGELGEFLEHLGDDVRGLSLTMPLKREVMALVRDTSARADLVGAANTLLVDDGRFSLDNTDLPGVAHALRERYDGPVTEVSLLGAGATAASSALALVELGATRVRVLARNPRRAEETRAVVARHPSHPEVEVLDLDTTVPTGEVLVSSVPVEAQSPEMVARCAGTAVVFEAIYDPWPTPLAASVLDGGGATGRVLVGGLDLLLHQAALQFVMFTGEDAPLGAMRAAGEDALAARSATSHGRAGRR